MTNRCLTYEEFLQVPQSFVDDVLIILEIKGKWGLDLTQDEKIIKSYIGRQRLSIAMRNSSPLKWQ